MTISDKFLYNPCTVLVSNWVSEILCNKLQSVAELPRVLVKVVGGNFLDVSFEVFGVDYSGRTF